MRHRDHKAEWASRRDQETPDAREARRRRDKLRARAYRRRQRHHSIPSPLAIAFRKLAQLPVVLE